MSRSDQVGSFTNSRVNKPKEVRGPSSFTKTSVKERERTNEEKAMKSMSFEFVSLFLGGEGEGEIQRERLHGGYPRERTNKPTGAR